MGTPLARVVVVALAVITVAACGSFGAADDPPGPAPANDASPSVDVAVPDAASPDAGTATRFCDRVTASFCEDFETPQKSYPGWIPGPDTTDLGGAISPVVHPTNGTSALRVSMAATQTNASGRVTREFRNPTLGKIHVEADIQVATTTFNNRLVVLAVYLGLQQQEPQRLAVELNVLESQNANITFTRGSSTTTPVTTTRGFRLGQPQHVSLDVDVYGSGPGAISFRIGDGEAATENITKFDNPDGPMRVLIGAHRYPPNDGAQGFEVYYDNVAVTAP